ncbi:TBC1 domain family member 31 isoform X6 [Diabrotica virgifera virgifera]|uniref:WD repeat-containing protein 67 n=1 Tax=Diabrotica virgifera virgifera TaxID=50390 RepID=A0ABM5KI59_DIAVI|nr:TBC1 domain family member 31 isoform X6 [Diabrotica virgifera virgifera]
MELTEELLREVNKKIFRLKPIKSNGSVLKVHHTLINAKLRFIYCCSHHTSDITALADSQGNIFLIDYSNGKFWGLPKFSSSTLIEFSPLNHDHLLIGIEGGDILICNSQSGYMVEKLLGHRYSVFRVSFSKEKLLSASKYEAITWDLESFSKLQVLTLEEDCSLKYVTFVPISGIILACFQDDLIQMWSPNTYETIKQFAPINWKNCLVKSVSFTRDGQIMVVAGHLPTISLFHLESSKLIKMISLNDYLHSIKRAEFITNDLDGGDNKILAILSGQGILYFLNTEEDKILSQLQCDIEINRFVCTPNGTHAICLLSSGEVEIFNIQQYLSPPVEIRVQKVRKKFLINRKRSLAEVQFVKQEIDSILDIKKLKFILKEYGEYPENYRIKIWERLLDLPNNVGSYNNVINHKTIIAFVDLHKKYPLEDKLFLTSLKKLLSNLVTWCPFFANVEYLPVFVFPFVKVFHNKPLACFEVVCTIIELEKSYSMQMKVKQQIINKELNKLQQMKDTFLQKQMKQPTTMFANNLHRPYLTDEYENLQMNKKFEITEDQQRKLQMAIQFEFINKFIKKIENELNSEDPKSTAKLKEVKTDLLKTSQKRHNKQPELKLLYANKHLEPQVVCKRHGSEDCFCEVFSSKCVRFSESTTGGSID